MRQRKTQVLTPKADGIKRKRKENSWKESKGGKEKSRAYSSGKCSQKGNGK
jgi:hypothetical protein